MATWRIKFVISSERNLNKKNHNDKNKSLKFYFAVAD